MGDGVRWLPDDWYGVEQTIVVPAGRRDALAAFVHDEVRELSGPGWSRRMSELAGLTAFPQPPPCGRRLEGSAECAGRPAEDRRSLAVLTDEGRRAEAAAPSVECGGTSSTCSPTQLTTARDRASVARPPVAVSLRACDAFKLMGSCPLER
jgi:hypothetical protein